MFKIAEFFERLDELINEKKSTDSKVSLRSISRDINVSNSLLSKYAKGEHSPKITIVKKCADYFNVSVEYMSGISDDRIIRYVSTKEVSNILPSGIVEVIKDAYLNGFTEEELKNILSFAKKMKNKE